MDWSNENVLNFLELYQMEPCIWSPRHKDHKDKKKINDAWVRISQTFGMDILKLKTKRDGLMATYRGLLRKKKASIRSGAGADDIYKPIWFAYEMMDNFLRPVYEVEMTVNTETPVSANF